MDDYIRREAAKAQIRMAYTRIEDRVAINCVLNDVPAADVAPVRHGRWADRREQDGAWSCTACGEEVTICSGGKDKTWEFSYCPNCGAAMYGDERDG